MMESRRQPNLENWRRIAWGIQRGISPGEAASRRQFADLLPAKLDSSIRRLEARPGNFQGKPHAIWHWGGKFLRVAPANLALGRGILPASFHGITRPPAVSRPLPGELPG